MRFLVVCVLGLLLAGEAGASILVANDARSPTLRVNGRGYAEVAWRDAGGARRTLVIPPTGRLLRGAHLEGRNVASDTLMVRLPMKVKLVRTPDGRLWALQRWQIVPGGPVELRFSRWRGEPTQIAAEAVCCKGKGETVLGTASFAGRPFHGIAYVDSLKAGGWKRLAGVFLRGPDGSFSLVIHPGWTGDQYRVSVAGPNHGATYAPDARIVVPASH